MEKHSKFPRSTVITSIVLALGLVLVSKRISNHPEIPSVSYEEIARHPLHDPGQAGAKADRTYLKGGVLQRNIHGEAEEFIEELTSETDPKFLNDNFTVHAGKLISITLRNQSTVQHQHNWTLLKAGSQQKVQAAAREAGPTWEWIPDTDDILAFVPLTQAGQSNTTLFRAPDAPGDYPFICTFPGHANSMVGTLHVVP